MLTLQWLAGETTAAILIYTVAHCGEMGNLLPTRWVLRGDYFRAGSTPMLGLKSLSSRSSGQLEDGGEAERRDVHPKWRVEMIFHSLRRHTNELKREPLQRSGLGVGIFGRQNGKG